ncbi:MAG: fibronectin type III domain-containing protein [Ruminococcus sp.]|nr:fibronectin type III domain-containing protein [Ruminococcus sp.]
MKKLVSILLAIVIICSTLPIAISASAATDETQPAAETATTETEPETEQVDTTEPMEESTFLTEPEIIEPTEEQSTTPTETETAELPSSPTEPTTAQPTNPPQVTPKPVTNLTVSAANTSEVRIKWTPSADATKYIIYRAAEKSDGTYGDYKKYKTINDKSADTFKDTGLTAGKAYKYKVYAYRVADGYTTHSSAATVTALTKLNPTSKVTLKDKSYDSMTVSWTKVKNAGKYIIYRSVEKDNGSFTAYKAIKTVKNNVKSYFDTNLKAGRIYKYKIVAKRTKSKITVQSKGKATKGMTALKTPKKFALKKVTTTAIGMAWSKVGRADRYELYRNGKKINTINKTSYTDSKISTGQKYTYKVRAVRIYNGKSYYGDFVSLEAETAISNVGGITVKSYNCHGLFTWKEVAGASGYDVYVQNAKGKWVYKGTSTVSAYLTGRLKLGKTYKYAFKAYKLVGGTKLYSKAKKAKVRVTDGAFGKTVSGTWVEVCTETQSMTMYVNNKVYITTPVVTGQYGPQGTTHGYHHVISKKTPARLRGSYNGHSWDVNVKYWLGFTSDGQGIHDATWRGAFGGNIYKTNGSNGCVNTPMTAVTKIYNKSYMGMPIIVY